MASIPSLLLVICCTSSLVRAGSLSSGGGGKSLRSLEDILCSNNSVPLSNYTLWLNSSLYTVSSGRHCLVENAEHLTIRGNATGLPTIIQCEREPENVSSVIFSFVNTTFLTIENIHFVGCGAPLTDGDLRYTAGNSSFYFGPGQAAALVCSHCSNLSLSNVKFSNSTGYAFAGINLFHNSVLDGVGILGEDDQHYSLDDPMCTQPGLDYLCLGRGILLMFTDSELDISSAGVVLNNSVFDGNSYHGGSTANVSFFCVRNMFEEFIRKSDISNPLPDVGALTIVYSQNKFAADVSILNSNFTNNCGRCFGAIFVLLHTQSADKGTQRIQGCRFIDNSVSPAMLPDKAAAMNYLGSDVTVYIQYEGDYVETLCLVMTDSFFKNLNSTLTPSISVIHFPNTHGKCTVLLQELSTNVSAKLLYVSGITRGDTLAVEIQDLVMKASNSYRNSLNGLNQNDGLLTFIEVENVTIHGTSQEKCQFNNLMGPVILTRGTDLFLTGEILFANNFASSGAYGGAIFLQSSSSLWLREPLRAEFCNNTAVSGGAIASGDLVPEFCVFQYITSRVYSEQNISSIDIQLTFTGNSANIAGNSIYMQHLYLCSTRLSSSTILPMRVEMIYNAIFKFERQVGNGLLEVSSNPNQICYCEGEPTNTNESVLNCAHNSLKVHEFTTYPGKDFTVCIVSVDEILNPVYTTVYNKVLPRDHYSPSGYIDDGNFNWRLSYGQDIVKVYGYNCTHLNFSILTNVSENSKGILALYPYGDVYCLAIPVVLKKCPPGFELVHSVCNCSHLLEKHGFVCDINAGIVRKPSKYSHWFGLVSNHTNGSGSEGWNMTDSVVVIGYASNCPDIYCSALLDISVDDYTMVCAHKRTGVLCGQCPEGMSTVVGFSDCRKCSNLWLLTIPLYALAGVLLVFVMFLLHLTVATGTINGLIFFANVFNLKLYHFLHYRSTMWLSVFISLLNLELGFPLCLYDGMTTLTATYMSFMVPLYLWFIVLLIILLSRYFRIVAKLVSRSAIPVLATIIHLSFSKLLSLSVSGLSVVTLEMEAEDGAMSRNHVWFYDGSVDYLGKYHLGLFFVSLLSLLLFLIPYTIFLTGIKWFGRFQLANRVRPFVDAFCAPYKDKWRFWFGARLWILIALYIGFASLRNSPSILTLLESIVLTLFTVAQVAIMPYKSVLINYLDLFFLVDCLLINIVALHGRGMEAALNVLMIPVFLMFCFIVGYHIYVIVRRGEVRKLLLERMPKEMVSNDSESNSSNDQLSDKVSEKSSLNSPQSHTATYSALVVNNPHSVHHYKPGELREPLLENDSDNQ